MWTNTIDNLWQSTPLILHYQIPLPFQSSLSFPIFLSSPMFLSLSPSHSFLFQNYNTHSLPLLDNTRDLFARGMLSTEKPTHTHTHTHTHAHTDTHTHSLELSLSLCLTQDNHNIIILTQKCITSTTQLDSS